MEINFSHLTADRDSMWWPPETAYLDPLSLVFSSHNEEREGKPGSFILDQILAEFGCDLNEEGIQYVRSSPYWLLRNPNIARGKSRPFYIGLLKFSYTPVNG